MTDASRAIPKNLKQQLRQESGFGCVVCGCPVIEYHHIVPFAQSQEHRAENLVVLCPTHHTQLGKAPPEYVRRVKESPRNLKTGAFSGELWSSVGGREIDIGGVRILNARPCLKFYGNTLLNIYDQDGVATIDLRLVGPDLFPTISIVANEVSTNVSESWDIEFRSNYLKIIRKNRREFLEIDLRERVAKIRCAIRLGQTPIELTGDTSKFGNFQWQGSSLDGNDLAAGLEIGEAGKVIIYPNYAMRSPAPLYGLGGRGRRAMIFLPIGREAWPK